MLIFHSKLQNNQRTTKSAGSSSCSLSLMAMRLCWVSKHGLWLNNRKYPLAIPQLAMEHMVHWGQWFTHYFDGFSVTNLTKCKIPYGPVGKLATLQIWWLQSSFSHLKSHESTTDRRIQHPVLHKGVIVGVRVIHGTFLMIQTTFKL